MHSDTRETILRNGLALFLRQGYAATGLKSILDAAGVPKGSFYHFFPNGKEAFAADVVDTYAALAQQTRHDLLFDSNVKPLVRLRQYFEYYAKHFESIGFREGCLLGDLGAEVSDASDSIRQRIDAAYVAWESDVARVLAEGIASGDIKPIGLPMQMARYLINGWEGALLRMKAEKSNASLDEFITLSFDVLLPQQLSKCAKKA
jgi:TetR/AcrR family transcriptional repressor of nem operon